MAQRFFYLTFQTPRAAKGANPAHPNLRMFAPRSGPVTIAKMRDDARAAARDARAAIIESAPHTAHSTRVLLPRTTMDTSVVDNILVSADVGGVSGDPVATAEVYLNTSDPRVRRVYSWIINGTRDHEIVATTRSKVVRKKGLATPMPMLAVGWSGGIAYPSGGRGRVTPMPAISVRGWTRNNFVETGLNRITTTIEQRLFDKYAERVMELVGLEYE